MDGWMGGWLDGWIDQIGLDWIDKQTNRQTDKNYSYNCKFPHRFIL